MSRKFPQEKKWTQLNKGDLLGELAMSKNIDLNDLGKLRLARKTDILSTPDTNDFTNILSIKYFSGKYYLGGSRRLWEVANPVDPLTADPVYRFTFGSTIDFGGTSLGRLNIVENPEVVNTTVNKVSSGSSATRSITISNKSNRALVVFVSFEEVESTGGSPIPTATFDGTNVPFWFGSGVGLTDAGDPNVAFQYAFRLENPDVTTGDVVVSFGTSRSNIVLTTIELAGYTIGSTISGTSFTNSSRDSIQQTNASVEPEADQHILGFLTTLSTAHNSVGVQSVLESDTQGTRRETVFIVGREDFEISQINSAGIATNSITTWNGALYVVSATSIAKYDGSWDEPWANSIFNFTSTNVNHPLEPNITNGNLLAGDGNLLKRVASDGTMETAITLEDGYEIRWIRRGVNVNYIGFDGRGVNDGGGVAIWDGIDTTLAANQVVHTKHAPLTGILDTNGILWVIFADGTLQRFSGSGFTFHAELPIFRNIRGNWGGSLGVGSKILPDAIEIVGDELLISLTANKNNTKFPAGIWAYNFNSNAFYHKYGLVKGENDFGQQEDVTAGSLAKITLNGSQAETNPTDSSIITTVNANGTTNILLEGEGFNIGQFETTSVESSGVTSNNISIWCKFSGIEGDNDKIVFKYRTEEQLDNINLDGTWTSANTFTSTSDDASKVEVGNEVTVLSEVGAGSTAHITEISETGGTYTFTLDENITGATNQSFKASVENWTRLSTEITKDDTRGFKKIPIRTKVDTTWIQVKVEMRGEGYKVAVEELTVMTSDNKPFN